MSLACEEHQSILLGHRATLEVQAGNRCPDRAPLSFTRGHSLIGVAVFENSKPSKRLKRLLNEVENANPIAFIVFFVFTVVAVVIAVVAANW